LEFSRGAEGN